MVKHSAHSPGLNGLRGRGLDTWGSTTHRHGHKREAKPSHSPAAWGRVIMSVISMHPLAYAVFRRPHMHHGLPPKLGMLQAKGATTSHPLCCRSPILCTQPILSRDIHPVRIDR